MKWIKNSIALVLICTTFICLGACSKDKDKNPENMGSATITVTGEVEGTYSGMADFHYLEVGSSANWDISIHDYSPQTFSLSIMEHNAIGTVGRPAPGTYSIGNAGIAKYSGGFIHIVNQDYVNTIDYGTVIGDNVNDGTITITESSENTVKGSFQFTANRYDDDGVNILGTINVSGEFIAHKRIMLN